MFDPIVAGLLLLAGILMFLVLLTQYRLERKISSTEAGLSRVATDFNAAIADLERRLEHEIRTRREHTPLFSTPFVVPGPTAPVPSPSAQPENSSMNAAQSAAAEVQEPFDLPLGIAPVSVDTSSTTSAVETEMLEAVTDEVAERVPPRLPRLRAADLPENVTPRLAADLLRVDLSAAEEYLLNLPHRRVARNILVARKDFLRFYNRYRLA